MQLHDTFCITIWYTKLSAISVLPLFHLYKIFRGSTMYFVFFILLEVGEWKIHAGNSTNSETSEYTV